MLVIKASKEECRQIDKAYDNEDDVEELIESFGYDLRYGFDFTYVPHMITTEEPKQEAVTSTD